MNTLAGLTAIALMGIGLLHALWPVVPWPFHSRLELARATMGWEADQAPGWWFAPACLGVTLLLAIASCVLLIRAETWPTSFPSWDVSGVIPWGIAVVLVARGGWGLVDPGSGSATAPAIYRRLNRRLYAPLCLVLGLLSGAVAAS